MKYALLAIMLFLSGCNGGTTPSGHKKGDIVCNGYQGEMGIIKSVSRDGSTAKIEVIPDGRIISTETSKIDGCAKILGDEFDRNFKSSDL